MRELGAQTVSVGNVCVDFRRPFPSVVKQKGSPAVERDLPSGELVEVYDQEPPDPVQEWFDRPLAPPTLQE